MKVPSKLLMTATLGFALYTASLLSCSESKTVDPNDDPNPNPNPNPITGVRDTLNGDDLIDGASFGKKGTTYVVTEFPSATGDISFGPNVTVLFKTTPYINGKMTILEGTTLLFDEDEYLNVDEGNLQILGSDSLPVFLTNSTAGKIWGYGSSGSYTGGIWFGSSANPLSKIDYAVISNATSGVYATVDGITITNSTFKDNENYGIIYTADKGPKKGFQGNSFDGNGISPLYMNPMAIGRIDAPLTFADSDPIEVDGGEVADDAVWIKQPVSYKFMGTVYVRNASGVELEIKEGASLLFTQDAYMNIGESATLTVSGTASKPVTMGPAETGKTWGYGSAQDYSGGIWIGGDASSNTNIQYLVLDSATSGVYDAQGVTIDNSTFSNCEFQGVFFKETISPVSFDNNTFIDNGVFSFSIGFGALTILDGSGTFEGTNSNVQVLQLNAEKTGTIPKLPVPYVIMENIYIENTNAAVVITIEPGTIFHVSNGVTINVRDNAALMAVGTVAEPIVFQNAVSGTTWGYGTAPDYAGGFWLDANSSINTKIQNVTVKGVAQNVAVYNHASVADANLTPISIQPGI